MSEANISKPTDATVAMADTNDTAGEDVNTIRLWRSHPNLFRSIATFAILSMCLGLNLLFYQLRPPNGYGIPQEFAGITFIVLGASKVFFLIVRRNLKAVRLTMAIEVAWMCFWGMGTGITWFRGTTSLQQFILYVGLSVFEIFLLIEPFANPLTGRKGA